MNINQTLDLFKKLLADTTQKREIGIYKRFIGLLSGLRKMELTNEQQQQVEEYINGLQLDTNTGRKHSYFTEKYTLFMHFLKTEFSFVTEGYYTAIGLSIGLSLGVGLGVSFGSIGGGIGTSFGMSMGAGIGMVLGMLVGAFLDAEAKKNGKVLIT